MLNYNFLVLGFVIVGLLFIPTSIPYMVPIAEASPMDNPADAINDLSLSSISKYSNQADRNSITLSWSAPNDNGSPILFYNIQVHEISGNGWTVLENDVYGTTYTHENAPTPYQFSYRVFAIAADGCNGSSSTFYNACNESNILHVVSLPNAESGAVNSSCNNSDLDDCGYFSSNFAPEISPIIGSANYLSQTNQQAHEFSGSTAKVYVTFNEHVPTMGSLINIVSVFPNSQTGVSLNNVNVPYTLTYPAGHTVVKEEGTLTSINTSDHYDMVLSINNAPVAGHYIFQTELISTSFDVYDPNTTPEPDSSPATGPFTITDDSTGGDCSTIGDWSSASKTCTLNTDVTTTGNNHGISIASSDIILDGAGHTVSGDNWNDLEGNSGVYVSQPVTGFVVKNFNIEGFHNGIKAYGTQSGTITENTVSSPGTIAINAYGARALQITDNIISNSQIGIELWNPSGNKQCSGNGSFVVSGNNVGAMGGSGIRSLIANGICFSNNTLESSFSVESDSKDVVIKNNHISGSSHGFEISRTSVLSMTNNTANNNLYNGFRFTDSNVITMTGNTANNNSMNGFTFNENSYASVFTGNVATGNTLNDFDGISETFSAEIVTVDSLNIGGSGTTGGDCDSVGTWVPTDLGPNGGTCTLSTDIQITDNGVGIYLASSRVTLDGAGHTVTGAQTEGYDHVGVKTCNQCHNMQIKDLTITKFAYGIYSNYANGLTITGVTITDIGKLGMSLSGATHLIVQENTVSSGIGISQKNPYGNIGDGSCVTTNSMFDGTHYWEYQVDLVLIENNIITGGLSTSDGVGYCIDGNTITDSSIHISYANDQVSPTNHLIKNNVVTGGGIKIVGSGNTFDSNTVTGGIIGFHNEYRAHDNIFTNNIANDNSQHGFKFDDCDEYSWQPNCNTTPVTFTDNVATGNGVSDIEGTTQVAITGEVIVSESSNNQCHLIGTWDSNSKTCTLEVDLQGNIVIYGDDITFNGGHHYIYNSQQAPSSGPAGITVTGSNNHILYSLIESYTVGILITGDNANVHNNSLKSNYIGFQISPNTLGAGNNTFTDNTIRDSFGNAFSISNSDDNKIYNNIFKDNTVKGNHVNGNNNIFTLDAPYGGNYYDNEADMYSSGDCQANWIDGPFCSGGNGPMVFGSGSNSVIDHRPWIEKNGWSSYVPPLTDTCFAASGYSIMQYEEGNAYQNPPGSFNMEYVTEQTVDFSGKIQPNEDGTCTVSNSLGLAGKSVTFTATKDDLTKTAIILGFDNQPISSSIEDDEIGGFFHFIVPFADVGDGGTWTYTYTFSGDDQYATTSKTGTISIPEPIEKIDTCFPSPSYSAPWESDPDTSSRDVTISGHLAAKQYGQCISLDELFLNEQSVVITATKNEVTKTSTVTTDNNGFFNTVFSFLDDSDEGPWTITYFFEGDAEYYSNTGTFRTPTNYILDVPAPPPNPKPIVNVPNDITLYTGTPSFSFAQSTINYNLYSGNSGPVFYPQPTASITGVSSEVVTFDVTATDNDLSSGPTCDVTSGSEFSVGTTTVTCTATDSDGGVGTASFDVTVIEQTIGGSGQVSCTPGSNSQFPIGSTPVSCSVTDGQGNASTDTFAVNVQPKSSLSDSQCRAAAGSGHDSGSVFVCEYPFHVTVEEGQRLVWVDTQPWQGFYHHSLTSNTGLFDQTDAGVMDMLPSAWGGVGVYSFYDKLNTALSGTITIAESDTTAPNIDVPNDLVISTEDQNGTPIVTYFVSASDDREVVSGPTCDVASGSTFSIGTTKVTCTASDAAGNTGTDSFDVTVEYTYIDTTPPGFAAYDNISKATTNPAGTVVTYTLPTATDNIGVTSGPTCDVPSGSVFPIGTTQVTCDASDAANNSASISFNVVMTKTYVDNTAPAVYITFGETSDEITIPADSSSGKELGFTVNAIDNVGVTVGPICSDAGVNLGVTPIGGQPGFYTIDSKMYPIGNSFVACTAYDAIGNSGSSIFAVTIQPYVEDTTLAQSTPNGNLNSEASCTSLVAGTWTALTSTCTITNPITINSDQTLTIDSGNTLTIKVSQTGSVVTGGQIKNSGTMTVLFKDDFPVWNTYYRICSTDSFCYGILQSTITNNVGGVINIPSSLTFSGREAYLIDTSTITNSGTINISKNIGRNTIINNSGGIINLSSIITTNDGPQSVFINKSSITNKFGGIINMLNLSEMQSTSINNSGTINILSSAGYTMSRSTIINNSGGIIIMNTAGNNSGIHSESIITNKAGATFTMVACGNTCILHSTVDNYGTFNISNPSNLGIRSSTITNHAGATLALSGAGTHIHNQGSDSAGVRLGYLTNDGLITISEGGIVGGVTTNNVDGNINISSKNGISNGKITNSGTITLFTSTGIDSSTTITNQNGIVVNNFETIVVDTTPTQSYTVLVNEMRGSITANDPGGCASFNPQTCYTPSDITINVNDTVTWVNNDSTNNWYTLMGNWGSLASSSGDNACDGPGKLSSDMCGVSGNDRTSWTHTFDTVGTYNYHDWVYQNSAQRPEGVVNVIASGAPAPVTPTPSTPAPVTPTTFTNSSSVGSNTFEPGVSFAPGKDFSELGAQTFQGTATFGEFTEFAKSQEFSNSMTFEKYQHFEDSTDFTAISQTFKEGTTFGDGTTFRSDGTQSLPVGTIPSFGVMLEEFSCVTADCKPTDTSKFLSPGDFLPSGIDPAASFSRITSADKSFTIDGLGLEMTFDAVSGDGTIKADLYDPANIPSSTDAGSGKVSVVTNTSESISTIGSVIDLSAGTATVSGSITITMPYLESNVPAGTAESDLVVLHYTNNQWVTESNCTVDTINNKITCIVTELSPFAIGSKSVTQTSEDEDLDVDTAPPEFEKVNNILVDATTSNGATVTYEIPTATDDGGITDTPICEPESGFFFPIGTTPVTCTVKDIAGIQGATVFLVTVKSLIAAPVEIPNSVSIKIGSDLKSDYNTKEAIFVSGVAAPFTEEKVSINVKDQSDNLVLVEQITPESSGVYTGIIFPNSLWSTSGNYTMSATYGTATDSTPFTFEFIQTEIDNSNIPTGITLNTNATGYALGDMISVTSQLTGGTSGQSIIIDVKDESGDNVVLQSLNTDDSGSTSLNFKAQDSWIPGKYNITATDGSPLWDYSTSELIQLVRPLPDITISPTITTTESGDVITSYKAGEIGYFSTALLSESTSNVLVTINVVDADDTTLGVAFFKSIIGKGDSEIILGFKIPEDAADGAAKIYVNTYTDWIDQGGIVISSELLSEVNIEGVISVENVSEDGTVLVIPKSGSGIPGCDQSIQGCYLPNPTIINVGDTVSFLNTDTAPHTFTSGSPSNGPNGIFDSSLLMSGDEYEFTFEDEGKYDYFDMIHPWMAGTIVVGNSESHTTLPENIIPKFSDISDITQSASSGVGNVISYPLPIAIGGVITSGTTCTPAPGSMFPIGSTQVTCTATNDFRNTGMTSFMVTINPILQTADQSLSVKVGKDSYNNLEPLFVTGSVGKITGDSINLQVYDELNHLISIEQTTPKETSVYNTIITSNELWSTSGEYTIIATYASASAQDTFEFELIKVEEIISEKIPTELYVSTDNLVYILGDNVFIDMQLVNAGAGESILLEVRDSQNDQVLLQSLNTDSDGNANISYQLESTHDSGIYYVIVTSANWDFITTETFVAVAQIPDIIVGDVVPTLQDGTEVDSFEVGDIGYFQTPIISNSTSNVLITVNIFDVENTPLGLAYFNSKVVDDTFDIVLGLQIPENVMPGLATVYINTYTDWVSEGGVPILEEQVSFIEISPSSISDLTLSTNSALTNSTDVFP